MTQPFTFVSADLRTLYKISCVPVNQYFIEKNENVRTLLKKYYVDEKDLFDLFDGKFISIDSKGLLFAWRVERFLRIETFSIENNRIGIEFHQIEYNGFKEKILKESKATFLKKDDWTLLGVD